MSEPVSTSAAGISLAALAVAIAGPLAGPYVLIVFAALAGALWPLSAAETMTRKAGGWLLVRCTLTAVVLTAALSQVLQRQYSIPVNEALAPVAFAIGALGNGWRPVFEALGGALRAALSLIGGGAKP